MDKPPILSLGGEFFDVVEPARFPQCTPRFLNQRAAASVGLGGQEEAWWARHFCRFEPLPGNLPQAFVHAQLMETAHRLGQAGVSSQGFQARAR